MAYEPQTNRISTLVYLQVLLGFWLPFAVLVSSSLIAIFTCRSEA